jgi:hypothetical protein
MNESIETTGIVVDKDYRTVDQKLRKILSSMKKMEMFPPFHIYIWAIIYFGSANKNTTINLSNQYYELAS